MQTLRKKNSPCKYKNEPSRFLGEGISFKAKLIGILEVNEARGDKMCQDALNDLKTAIRAAGEHKQRITISIAIDGLRLRDEKTGDCMYHHPVHKISFIAQDMSDSRAFGYIFGSPDTGHRFFGIKTDKTASQVVISMRDLFQVVFELKKKEIEMAKHHIEQHQIKYGGSSYADSITSIKDEPEIEKPKGKYPQPLKTSSITSMTSEASAPAKTDNSEAIADLLDLEDELNSIQQGISQMERITPSDPFGPLSKGDPFSDPFDENYQKVPPKPLNLKNRSVSQSSSKDQDLEKPNSLFGSAASTSSKTHFFSQFSPSVAKPKPEESHWFDQETESLFDDAVNVSNAEPTSSPVTFHTPTAESEQGPDDKVSPAKADVFTDLDPLGTGRVKPYIDKKDFFQELKNPPKKVLKELLGETSTNENTHYFPATFESNKNIPNSNVTTKDSSVIKNTLVNASSNILNSFPSKDSSATSKYSRIDPFNESDPFEKTDPFLEESFPQSIGFPPLFSGKKSFDSVFQDKASSRYEKVASMREKDQREEPLPKMSPPKASIFSSGIHGPLRVSLPPENVDSSTPLSISTITSKFRSSPSPPEEAKTTRRKYYQTLKHSKDDRNDDSCQSPNHEELFYRRSPKLCSNISPKSHFDRKSPYKEKTYSIQSPPFSRYEKTVPKTSASSEFLEFTPDPPPRPKTALFSIKPPPLPPKKQNQPTFKPPARPPSLEEYSSTQYDYIKNHEETGRSRFELKDPPKSPNLRRETRTEPQRGKELRKHNSDVTSASLFPLLPPPPQRKSPGDSSKVNNSPAESRALPQKPTETPEKEGSILNITLNQLDHSGLENLAVTLGIPSENIYNMTLQELTKRLAQKYLGPLDAKEEQSLHNESGKTFQADFDGNFNGSVDKKDSPPPFDKYAVFKELIKNETQKMDDELEKPEEAEESEEMIKTKERFPEDPLEVKKKEEEDRYAALRQLSLCAQKSENLSEELDVSNEDDSSARADNISDIIQKDHAEGYNPINTLDLTSDSHVTRAAIDWPSLPLVSEETGRGKLEEFDCLPSEQIHSSVEKDWSTPLKKDDPLHDKFTVKANIFSSNQMITESKPTLPVAENWATFEKCPKPEETVTSKRQPENENENSPFSSDGKEDIKEVPLDWQQKATKERKRSEVPWQDEDESWDDYSPKESYWSEESSHEEKSPDKRDEELYKRTWNKPPTKEKPPPRNEKGEQWNRREKWQEDTEDEYDESWRKHRCRVSSCDDERKGSWENEYDCYEKQSGWYNSRGEPWDDAERYGRGSYTERRKRSESDDEYRRRCDSDASDREYVWTFKRGYPDTYGWSEKQKQYYASPMYQSSHWPDHCHESRSKHKKGACHKRPSSASETKRNYEKMYSPVEHIPRSAEKGPISRGSGEDEFMRYSAHKDPRYHYSLDSTHHYSSYDRRASAMHAKRTGRGKRNDSITSKVSDVVSPPANSGERSDEKPFPYFPPESTRDQISRNEKSEESRHPVEMKKSQGFQFEDDFIPSSFDRLQNKSNPSPSKNISKSPRKKILEKSEWTSNEKSTEDKFFPSDNNNENFANFNDEFEVSPKKCKENIRTKGENCGVILPKLHMKPKNHFSILNRQDSSASLRKSESINIFSRENDPFEDDDFFSSASSNNPKLSRFSSEKSKSNSNVSDPFQWKEVFGDSNFQE